MTPTPAGISKKLEAALKKASPKELARIMVELQRPGLDQAFERKAAGHGPKVEAQLVYIRDNFVQRLPINDWIEYRNEVAWLTELDLLYRIQVKDIEYLEALLINAEHFLLTLDYLEEGFFQAGYELGEDETQEDLETSPLKRYRDNLAKHRETAKEHIKQGVRRRAELCLSSVWKEYGRPCPFDPAWDGIGADYLGEAIPGSKELPLDPEEVLAAERRAQKALDAAKAGKSRRKAAAKK